MEIPVKMLRKALIGLDDEDMVIIKSNQILMPAPRYIEPVIENIKEQVVIPETQVETNSRLADLLF